MQSDPYKGGRTALRFYSIPDDFFYQSADEWHPEHAGMIYFLGCWVSKR
jgi:hypothetical protein